MAAFGRGECFVEQYLDSPRHVETQVLADKHGNVVVVSTRDCSLQRRHQKLVEESPSPALNADQRMEIGSTVCAALRKLAMGPVVRVALAFDEEFWRRRTTEAAFFHNPKAAPTLQEQLQNTRQQSCQQLTRR